MNDTTNDNMNDKCVLDNPQSKFLYSSSYFSIISWLYALYKKQYILSFIPGTIFISSINYWSNPRIYCKERYIDILCVQICLYFQLYYCLNAQYLKQYCIVTSIGIISFIASYYLSQKWDILNIKDQKERRRKMWIVTYLHSGVHIFGNIANIILYSGYIKPQSSNII